MYATVIFGKWDPTRTVYIYTLMMPGPNIGAEISDSFKKLNFPLLADERRRSGFAHEFPVSLAVGSFLASPSVIPVSIFMPPPFVPVPPASDSVVTTFALSLQFDTS